jgi:hypothetical protein
MKIIYFTVLLIAILYTACGSSDSSNSTTPSVPPVEDEQNSSSSSSMSFAVNIPSLTPSDEFVCIYFNDLNPPIKMNNQGANRWQIDLNSNAMDSTEYRYSRNCEYEAADEYFDTVGIGWRSFTFEADTAQEDTVFQWRWLTEDLLSFDLNTTGYTLTKPTDINKSNFIAGVMINDWWREEWMESMNTTLSKVVTDTNSSWVQYTPIPEITELYPLPKITKVANNGTSDTEMVSIIQKAHDKGLKFFLNPSPWSFQEDNSTEDHTQDWWNEFEAQWRPIMLEYAQMAEDNGVEMLAFRMWPNIDGLNDSENAKINDLASSLLTDVRAIYHGKISVQSICYDTSKHLLDVHKNSDYVTMKIFSFYPWHLGDTKDDNVSQIFNTLQVKMNDCHTYYTDQNISNVIVEQLSAASYDGSIINLNPSDEGIDSFHEDNASYALDLQEQADVYEATLRLISQEDWIVGNFAFTYFYWDSVGKDINIRAKPAEKVVAKWYGWMK